MPRFTKYMLRHPDGDGSGAGDGKDVTDDKDKGAAGDDKNKIDLSPLGDLIGPDKEFKTAADLLASMKADKSTIGSLGTKLESMGKQIEALSKKETAKDKEVELTGANKIFSDNFSKSPITTLAEVVSQVLEAKLTPIVGDVSMSSVLTNHLPSLEKKPGFAKYKNEIIAKIKENPKAFNSAEGVNIAYSLVIGQHADEIVNETRASAQEAIKKELAEKGYAVTFTGGEGGGAGGREDKDKTKLTPKELSDKVMAGLINAGNKDPLAKFDGQD